MIFLCNHGDVSCNQNILKFSGFLGLLWVNISIKWLDAPNLILWALQQIQISPRLITIRTFPCGSWSKFFLSSFYFFFSSLQFLVSTAFWISALHCVSSTQFLFLEVWPVSLPSGMWTKLTDAFSRPGCSFILCVSCCLSSLPRAGMATARTTLKGTETTLKGWGLGLSLGSWIIKWRRAMLSTDTPQIIM